MPTGKEIVALRHPEWIEHQRTWRWLQDSLEGGDRYRYADYTTDPTRPTLNTLVPWYQQAGQVDPLTNLATGLAYNAIVDRNLVPHRHEMSPDGRDLYAMRLARTPIPEVLCRTIELHLSKVLGQPVHRDGPTDVTTWWDDVDGRGTPIADWIAEEAGPLLLALGQIDLVAERPYAADGTLVRTLADQRALGLDTAVVRVVLPENLVWWRLDPRGREYEEALVLERSPDGKVAYRHWTRTDSTLYTDQGRMVSERSYEHGLGVVPMVRVFDRRKPRCEHVGRPRYQEVADLQLALYNGRSELILSDSNQAHAILMLPEDAITEDGEISLSGGGALPMKAIKGDGGFTSGYQAPAFLDPPKGAQAEVRAHLKDLADDADRAGTLAKPAGMSTSTSVSQSGISKVADQQDGNAILEQVSKVLAKLEHAAARLALTVIRGREPTPADMDAAKITYPASFDLFSAGDVAAVLEAVQRAASTAGALPLAESALLQRLVTLALPGLEESESEAIGDEIEAFVADRAAEWAAQPAPQQQGQQGEAAAAGTTPDGSDVAASGRVR